MTDACCSSDEVAAPEADDESGRLWQVGEIRAAVAAAVVLLAGWLLSWTTTVPDWIVVGLEAVALVIAASTFVPGRCAACSGARSASAR